MILVIDKESGVNSEAVFSALCGEGIFFIHRLDRNTEGLMVFARTRAAEEALLSAFRERRVEKRYRAEVLGKFNRKQAVCTAYLKKDSAHARVMVSASPVGERIVTEYRVLEEREETSILEVILHTGKTHQIRAHMAFLGHPVAGDTKYGDAAYNAAHHLTRQRLLAKQLSFCGTGLPEYLSGKTFVSSRTL